jgi:DNA invertase Pin-like site-specific DNA recombinase
MKLAIYARVSTKEQSVDTQLEALRSYAAARNWQVFREYCDQGISGAKDSRPALNELMQDARRRKFDVVAVWKFDRMARSTSHLLRVLAEFRALGIQFCSYTEAIDTSTPIGEVMFTIIGALAQFERELIRERVQAGVDRARRNGKPWGRKKIAIAEIPEGLSLRETARILGVSRETVRRRKAITG